YEAVALGYPDDRLGEGIALIVRPDRSGQEEKFKAFLKGQLPNFMQPGPILWREDLPRSPNGKLDRVALKAELTA
ncbi:MAG TPA: AMP-binding protein, partial [Allosphingosinicella sp.]|nr:AMP-binding protein [Allosphingosinicella sp.]